MTALNSSWFDNRKFFGVKVKIFMHFVVGKAVLALCACCGSRNEQRMPNFFKILIIGDVENNYE